MSVAEKYTTLTEKIPQVYDAGKQAEYDVFWDAFQVKGNRTEYDYAFRSNGWNNTNFKPKYDIKPTSAMGLFYKCDITDVADILEKQGAILDLSACSNLNNLCLTAQKLTRLPKIDASSATTMATAFSWCQKLKTIDELVFSSKLTNAGSAFNECRALTNFTASGEIACTISFQHSPLNLASATSVINALKDCSESNAFAYSVAFSSTTVTLLNEAGAIFNGMTWTDYLDTIGWNS